MVTSEPLDLSGWETVVVVWHVMDLRLYLYCVSLFMLNRRYP